VRRGEDGAASSSERLRPAGPNHARYVSSRPA
jgi:hypothetical protein